MGAQRANVFNRYQNARAEMESAVKSGNMNRAVALKKQVLDDQALLNEIGVATPKQVEDARAVVQADSKKLRTLQEKLVKAETPEEVSKIETQLTTLQSDLQKRTQQLNVMEQSNAALTPKAGSAQVRGAQ
jgi:septal ring factor EnvC (AmiA/AmiB activator)